MRRVTAAFLIENGWPFGKPFSARDTRQRDDGVGDPLIGADDELLVDRIFAAHFLILRHLELCGGRRWPIVRYLADDRAAIFHGSAFVCCHLRNDDEQEESR